MADEQPGTGHSPARPRNAPPLLDEDDRDADLRSMLDLGCSFLIQQLPGTPGMDGISNTVHPQHGVPSAVRLPGKGSHLLPWPRQQARSKGTDLGPELSRRPAPRAQGSERRAARATVQGSLTADRPAAALRSAASSGEDGDESKQGETTVAMAADGRSTTAAAWLASRATPREASSAARPRLP